MKKLLLASALFLSACSGTSTISGAEIIAAVKSTCGVVVPIADIIALVATENATVTVASLAAEICKAVTAQKASAPGGAGAVTSGTVVINGVVIHYTS